MENKELDREALEDHRQELLSRHESGGGVNMEIPDIEPFFVDR